MTKATRNRSKLRRSDLLAQAVDGILSRPARAALTMLGIVLGVGAFVAVVGLSSTASGQISKTFTALSATEVTANDVSHSQGAEPGTPVAFPQDSDERAERIRGVRSAGVYWTIGNAAKPVVEGVVLPGVDTSRSVPVPLVAASSGIFAAVHSTIGAGTVFDHLAEQSHAQVAVLGISAARRLGVTDLGTMPAIFADGIPFTVVGIVTGLERRPELLDAVIIPRTTASALWGEDDISGEPVLEVDTTLGAAGVVADQLVLAVRPDQPHLLRVSAPPDPHDLRDAVHHDLQTLFLALAGLCLVIGAVGIANTTMVAVLERSSEIGLRRALGARRVHIAAQFLVESALLGLSGGLIGAAAGIGCVVGVAIVNAWTPIVAVWLVWIAPPAGAMVGLLAGLYPALRATHIEPVQALQR